MASLILNNRIVGVGEIEQTPDGFIYNDILHPYDLGYSSVSEEPPSKVEWIYLNGEFIDNTPPKPEVPQSITRAQAKLALLNAGLLDDVQAAIDGIQDLVQRRAVQIEWADRLTFERDSKVLHMMAQAIGMSSEDMDNLFIQAIAL